MLFGERTRLEQGIVLEIDRRTQLYILHVGKREKIVETGYFIVVLEPAESSELGRFGWEFFLNV